MTVETAQWEVQWPHTTVSCLLRVTLGNLQFLNYLDLDGDGVGPTIRHKVETITRGYLSVIISSVYSTGRLGVSTAHYINIIILYDAHLR